MNEVARIKANDLKNMRLKRNLSQKVVSDTLGFDRSFLAKVEKGERTLSEAKFEQLIRFYQSIHVSDIIEAKFDYVRIRFPTHDIKKIIEEVLCMEFCYFDKKGSGLFGYSEMYYLGMIRVLNSVKGSERGVLIELSGQGCRNYDCVLEERQEGWKEFIQRCYENKGVATRIDVALDDYKEIFSIHEMARKIKKGEYITKFRTKRTIFQDDLGDDEKEGATVYLGSRQSLMHFCFYQKNYEISKREKIPIEEIEVKNRYEVRMINDKARMFLKEYMENFDFAELILGIISNQLTMLEIDSTGEAVVWKKWLKFIGNSDAINLKIEPEKPTLKKKVAYVDYFMARTLKTIQVVDDVLGTNRLKDIINKAELREADEKLIEIEIAETSDFAKRTGVLM